VAGVVEVLPGRAGVKGARRAVKVDFLVSESHFADHAYPIWQALTDPGDFILTPELISTRLKRWEGGNANVTDPTRPVVVASYGDLKRARRQGRKRIARLEHGAGQSYDVPRPSGSYAGGPDAQDVGLFLVPNEYSASRWKAAYPDARVEIVGCPKLDSLPRKDPAVPLTVVIAFHWDCHLVPETVSAFETFRSALEPLRDAYNVIGHGHPRAWVGPPSLEKRYRRAGIEAVRDFDEVCRRADVYICDNSSSLYEFAATGRPVVVMNSRSYRREVSHGLRFWDSIPGIQVDSPGTLVGSVERALQDPPELRRARKKALDLVYPIRTGAAELAARALEDWA
jgi:hypothetical protein